VAFVLLTRSKMWCVVTGRAGAAVFDEIEQARRHLPALCSPGFSRGDRADVVEYEGED
jgi:hypothetical protein